MILGPHRKDAVLDLTLIYVHDSVQALLAAVWQQLLQSWVWHWGIREQTREIQHTSTQFQQRSQVNTQQLVHRKVLQEAV